MSAAVIGQLDRFSLWQFQPHLITLDYWLFDILNEHIFGPFGGPMQVKPLGS
jgi:hypothetical protein